MWDARLTEPLKIVRLGHADGSASLRIIKQVLFCAFLSQPSGMGWRTWHIIEFGV